MASQSEYLRQHRAAIKALHAHQAKMEKAGNRDANDPTYLRLNGKANETAKALKGWRKFFG